jgi:hypothetical protein
MANKFAKQIDDFFSVASEETLKEGEGDFSLVDIEGLNINPAFLQEFSDRVISSGVSEEGGINKKRATKNPIFDQYALKDFIIEVVSNVLVDFEKDLLKKIKEQNNGRHSKNR